MADFPQKKEAEKRVHGFVRKTALASGYGFTRQAFYLKLKRLGIEATTGKSYSPKEVDEIVDLFGTPDWELVKKSNK